MSMHSDGPCFPSLKYVLSCNVLAAVEVDGFEQREMHREKLRTVVRDTRSCNVEQRELLQVAYTLLDSDICHAPAPPQFQVSEPAEAPENLEVVTRERVDISDRKARKHLGGGGGGARIEDRGRRV